MGTPMPRPHSLAGLLGGWGGGSPCTPTSLPSSSARWQGKPQCGDLICGPETEGTLVPCCGLRAGGALTPHCDPRAVAGGTELLQSWGCSGGRAERSKCGTADGVRNVGGTGQGHRGKGQNGWVCGQGCRQEGRGSPLALVQGPTNLYSTSAYTHLFLRPYLIRFWPFVHICHACTHFGGSNNCIICADRS